MMPTSAIMLDLFALPISYFLQGQFIENKFTPKNHGSILEWIAKNEAKIGYKYFEIKEKFVDPTHSDRRAYLTLKFHHDFICNYP